MYRNVWQLHASTYTRKWDSRGSRRGPRRGSKWRPLITACLLSSSGWHLSLLQKVWGWRLPWPWKNEQSRNFSFSQRMAGMDRFSPPSPPFSFTPLVALSFLLSLPYSSFLSLFFIFIILPSSWLHIVYHENASHKQFLYTTYVGTYTHAYTYISLFHLLILSHNFFFLFLFRGGRGRRPVSRQQRSTYDTRTTTVTATIFFLHFNGKMWHKSNGLFIRWAHQRREGEKNKPETTAIYQTALFFLICNLASSFVWVREKESRSPSKKWRFFLGGGVWGEKLKTKSRTLMRMYR